MIYGDYIAFAGKALILANQEEILSKLNNQEEKLRSLLSSEKKVCKKCNYSYDFDYKSCPKCGNKEN